MGKVGYAPAPMAVTPNGTHWLWSWAFAIPNKAKNAEGAKKFVQATLKAMETADPTNPCIKKVPYTGITFVGIPEFQSLGTVIGQNIAGLVSGSASINQTLKSNQNQAERTMKQGGYIK